MFIHGITLVTILLGPIVDVNVLGTVLISRGGGCLSSEIVSTPVAKPQLLSPEVRSWCAALDPFSLGRQTNASCIQYRYRFRSSLKEKHPVRLNATSIRRSNFCSITFNNIQ